MYNSDKSVRSFLMKNERNDNNGGRAHGTKSPFNGVRNVTNTKRYDFVLNNRLHLQPFYMVEDFYMMEAFNS